MTVSAIDFRSAFPEFAGRTDAQINFWLGQAAFNLNAAVFGSQMDLATMLFVAHYISMAMLNEKAAAGGGVPGQSYGPVTSKSVGPVSKSMSAGSSTTARAGQWNNTSYGQQLYALMSASSAGPLYNPGCVGRTSGQPPNRLAGYPGYGRGW